MRSLPEIIIRIKQECVEVSLDRYTLDDLMDTHRIIHDLQFDSLDYASIMLACEAWLDVHLDEAKINWSNIQTIAQLAELLYQCQH